MAAMELDAGYRGWRTRDLLREYGIQPQVAKKGPGTIVAIQASDRWPVERTHAHFARVKKLAVCTEQKAVIVDAYVSLANALLITRRLQDEIWLRYRWEGRPARMPHAWRSRATKFAKMDARWQVKTVAEREAEARANDPRWQVEQ